MLVEFSVSNFRSISEKVVFSVAASAAAAKVSNLTFATGNSLAPNVLTSAIILGPNASGKSSLIRAMDFFQWMVVNSAKSKTQGERIQFSNNKLATAYHSKPTEMEIIFSHEGEMFQYGFCLTNERVLEEWLFARTSKPASKTKELFYRKYVSEKDVYLWKINDSQVAGEKENWKSATRSNALFLSTAVQFNSTSLQKPFEWLQQFLNVIGANERIDGDFTARKLEDPKYRSRILDLITALDLKIEDFAVEAVPAKLPENAENFFSESLLKELSENLKNQTEYRVRVRHENEEGEYFDLPLNEESDGTQAIFGMAGPIFNVLEKGMTLVIDELSNSLHPLALRGLVNIFQDPNHNDKGAQLIFSSHETSILAGNFLHKDQIWFIERPTGHSTKLTPLSDFGVRDTEAFQRSYLGGRFGAIPNIRRVRRGS